MHHHRVSLNIVSRQCRLRLFAEVVLSLICVTSGLAQDRSTWRWYFGKGLGLDFNQLPPTLLLDGKQSSVEGTSSLCDEADGSLLLYTDGNTVWDRSHTAFASQLNPLFASSTQTALFIRQPNAPNLVHLFLCPQECSGPARHVLIDLQLRGGLGDTVLVERKLMDQRVAEKIAAVSASNGSDWWVVFRGVGADSSAFMSFYLGSDGLSAVPVRSKTGKVINPNINSAGGNGQLVFSADGSRLLSANCMADIEVFDFDRVSGQVRNPKLYVPNSIHQAYGTAFSASGRYVYTARQGYQADTIVRFDLQAADVQASRTVIAARADTYGQMLLGRDGTIYIAAGSSPYLCAIVDADSINPQYHERGISLPDSTNLFIGLPDFPLRIKSNVGYEPSVLNAPTYACIGSTIAIQVHSTLGDSLEATFRFEDGSDTTIIAKAPDIWLNRTLSSHNYYRCTVYVRGIGQQALLHTDTLLASTDTWYDCCTNVVRNGNFLRIAAGGQCFPVDYETDLDFRRSQNSPCIYYIDNPGFIASQSSASFGNKAWSGLDHTNMSSFILYGEPLPNVSMRAWYERLPVWSNSRYHVRAWVKNVEKYQRFDTTGMQLQFSIQVTQNGVKSEVARIDNVRYDQGWMAIEGDWLSTQSGDAEVAIVVFCYSSVNHCFGFAVDDISCEPLSSLSVDAGPALQICRGNVGVPQSQVSNASKIEWSPHQGLSDYRTLQPSIQCDSSCVYILNAWDLNGCLFQDSLHVTVVDPQHPKIIASQTTLCPGDSAILTLDRHVRSISWSSFAHSDSLIVHATGSYGASGIDSLGCAFTTDSIVISDPQSQTVKLELPDDSAIAVGSYERISIRVQPWSDALLGKSYILRLRFRTEAFTVDPSFVVSRDSLWTIAECRGTLNDGKVLTSLVLRALLSRESQTPLILDSLFVDSNCPIHIQSDSNQLQLRTCWLKTGFIYIEPTTLLSLYPQPVDNMLHVIVNHPADSDIPCTIYNAVGAEVLRQQLHCTQSSTVHELQIDAGSLSPGWYVLRCDVAEGPQVLPFLVIHAY